MLLGPIFKVIDPTHFNELAPIVGPLALIVILFDSGLQLNLFKVLRELPKAFGFTLLVVLFSILLVAGVAYAFGWNLLHALLLGAVLGGTSAETIYSLVTRLSIPNEVKILIDLESVINDALCIVAALALIQVIQMNTVDVGLAARSIASAFSIAIVVGFVAALFWLTILRLLSGKPFSYVITLGALFLLYAAVESLQASGAVAILIFGLVLGNANEVTRALKMEGDYAITPEIKTVQTEITFFVRTFFFVFLGLLFSFAALSVQIAFFSVAVVLVLFAARLVSAKIIGCFDSQCKRFQYFVASMMPRGVVTSVLAVFPLTMGIKIPLFAEIVLLVLFLSNVFATAAVFYFERRGESVEPGSVSPPKPVVKEIRQR